MHGPTGSARVEAQHPLVDIVADLKGKKLTVETLVPMFIPGPNIHRELVSIKATIKATGLTHELTDIDPLGAHRVRTRLPQAQQSTVLFESLYTGPTTATSKANPNSLPLQASGFACGAPVCMYCYFIV